MTMAPLWSAQEVAAIFDSDTAHDWQCEGISIDSRTIEEGDLFFALTGPHSDGHDYVKMAIAKGAVAAVVSKEVPGLDPRFLIMVDDVKAALDALGRAARARVDIPVIAITGSVGKTGSKEMLKKALGRNNMGRDKKAHASILSYNNDIGVPLSLARMRRDADFGIFELGMNHKGELGSLSQMVRPHVAIITNVELAHSEHFANIEEIADAKAEIFAGLLPGAAAILNHDNDQYDYLRAKARAAGVENITSFGTDDGADIQMLRQIFLQCNSSVIARIQEQIVTYNLGMVGAHWVMNSLAVLAAVRAVGADLGQAALGLAQLKPLRGRGRRYQVRLDAAAEAEILLIDESYNANPASMTAALVLLACSPGKRHMAILGDMAELGEKSGDLHGDLSEVIKDKAIDRVYMVGPHMKNLSDRLPTPRNAGHFDTRECLEAALIKDLSPGDVVMVKGSNASGMSHVVEKIRNLEALALKQAI